MNRQAGNRAISVPRLPVDYFNASLDVQSCSRGCCLVDCCPGDLGVLFRSPTRDSEPADETEAYAPKVAALTEFFGDNAVDVLALLPGQVTA